MAMTSQELKQVRPQRGRETGWQGAASRVTRPLSSCPEDESGGVCGWLAASIPACGKTVPRGVRLCKSPAHSRAGNEL